MLDTCTVSDFVKGDQKTIGRLKSTPPLQIKISAITAYELRYGLQKNPSIKKSTKNAVLGFLNDIEVIPFGSNEANYAAVIRAQLEKSGTPIGAYDVLIAATASANDFVLVTSNAKEFKRVNELKIENWR